MLLTDKKSRVNSKTKRWSFHAAAAIILAIAITSAWIAYVRLWQKNFRCVVPGQVYRSAQPLPKDLRGWTRTYRLKSALNLRGWWGNEEYTALRKEAYDLGLKSFDLELDAWSAPTRHQLLQLIEAIERLPRPMLIFCRAGVDRSGMASVLAAMGIAGQSYEKAKNELFGQWQYIGGKKENSTGSLFAAYEGFCRRKGVTTGGWSQFKRWAVDEYWPYYYHVSIEAPKRLDLALGKHPDILLKVTNRSTIPIPFADSKKQFTVAAFLGASVEDHPDMELGPRISVPRKNLLPGESIDIIFRLTAPQLPGVFDVGFDLIEEHHTWFARQGSPITRCRLTVYSTVPGDKP